MSEQPAQQHDEHAAVDERDLQGPGAQEPTERTGHAGVDDVIASLDGLESRPVAEHVEVFETAHERLRGALSEADTDTSAS